MPNSPARMAGPFPSRAHAAAFRTETHPQPEDGPQGRNPHARGHTEQPPPQSPRERSSKFTRITARSEQRLRYHARVFRIVTEHAAAKEEGLLDRFGALHACDSMP